ERGGVQDDFDVAHALVDETAVDDRPHPIRERRAVQVDADGVVRGGVETPHQPFAEMAGAAGDQDSHARAPESAPRTASTNAPSLSASSRPSLRTPEYRSTPNGRTIRIASTTLSGD